MIGGVFELNGFELVGGEMRRNEGLNFGKTRGNNTFDLIKKNEAQKGSL
jgi:hypothetical protein